MNSRPKRRASEIASDQIHICFDLHKLIKKNKSQVSHAPTSFMEGNQGGPTSSALPIPAVLKANEEAAARKCNRGKSTATTSKIAVASKRLKSKTGKALRKSCGHTDSTTDKAATRERSSTHGGNAEKEQLKTEVENSPRKEQKSQGAFSTRTLQTTAAEISPKKASGAFFTRADNEEKTPKRGPSMKGNRSTPAENVEALSSRKREPAFRKFVRGVETAEESNELSTQGNITFPKVEKSEETDSKRHDVFGVYVADTIRSLPPLMAHLSKKLISDVLYHGENGDLNANSKIVVNHNLWSIESQSVSRQS